MAARIHSLVPADTQSLEEFYSTISGDPAAVRFFHPHSLDTETARRICLRVGIDADEYFAAFDGGRILGYGMLRGWDEGYEVPSFGVCVRADARGQGVAGRLLDYALRTAEARGASRVMLKVYGENTIARGLYERAGFVFQSAPTPGVQSIGFLELG